MIARKRWIIKRLLVIFLVMCLIFVAKNNLYKLTLVGRDLCCRQEKGKGENESVARVLKQPTLYSNGRHWKDQVNIADDKNSFDYTSGRFSSVIILDCQINVDHLKILDSFKRSADDIAQKWILLLVNLDFKERLEMKQRKFVDILVFEDLEDSNRILKDIEQVVSSSNVVLPENVIYKMASVVYVKTVLNAPWVVMADGTMPIDLILIDRYLITEGRRKRGIVYQGPGKMFQPCRHFMDPFAWSKSSRPMKQSLYQITNYHPIAIFQIVDGCRMSGLTENWMKFMDRHAPIPSTMADVLAPINFRNIIVHRQAVWTLVAAMAISKTPDNLQQFSISDNIISILVQKLMWTFTGDQLRVGFLPGSFDKLGQHCQSCEIEQDLKYSLKHRLETDIYTWSCSHEQSFNNDLNLPHCMTKISNLISSGKYVQKIKKDISSIMSVWGKVTEKFGLFEEKPLVELIESSSEAKFVKQNDTNYFYFSPAKSVESIKPNNIFENLCSTYNFDDLKEHPRHVPQVIPDAYPEHFNNIALVISFNQNKFLENIYFLQHIFSRYFKNIIYCANGINVFEQKYQIKFKLNPVSFVEVNLNQGMHGHKCVIAAMEINYDVEGYLYISDDVILNVWNLHFAPLDVPWFQADMRVADLNSTFVHGHRIFANWYPWRVATGRKAITKSMHRLKKLKNNPTIGKRVTWFMANIEKSTSCNNCVVYMDADFYFIPSYMSDDFIFFSQFFTKVFQELSVPTILTGITPRADMNVYKLRGFYLIDESERKYFYYFYSYETCFLHPLKIGLMFTERRVRSVYCGYLERINEDLLRFKG